MNTDDAMTNYVLSSIRHHASGALVGRGESMPQV
jgi:hypothetical protein